MLKPVPFANAMTAVGILLYVGCRVLSLVIPGLLFNIAQSWFHTFNLGTVKDAASMDINTFILGGVTFGVLVWFTGYVFAYLYNRLAK